MPELTGVCLNCDHSGLRKVRQYRTKTDPGKEIFRGSWLVTCDNCGLVQALPRPSLHSLENYYLEDYRRGCFAGSDVADVKQFPKDNLFYYNRGRSIAELVGEYVRSANPRIMDIGAGFGHVLDALANRFPDSERLAIEFSRDCVDHLTSLGISVTSSPIERALPELGGKYDIIILSHVLEHLLEPKRTLELLRGYLKEDGILYIEVPNIPREGLLKYPDQVWAPRFDEPHITFFSLPTLRRLLASVGYELKFCNTAGPEYNYISSLAFHLPHWRWFLQRVMPKSVFHFIRNLSITRSFRVQEHEGAFDKYGGERIWIRSLSALNGPYRE